MKELLKFALIVTMDKLKKSIIYKSKQLQMPNK